MTHFTLRRGLEEVVGQRGIYINHRSCRSTILTVLLSREMVVKTYLFFQTFVRC